MTRLAVSVEGQTEEEFVKQVVAEHLRSSRVESTPIVLGRARGRAWWWKCVIGSTRFGNGGSLLFLRCSDFTG